MRKFITTLYIFLQFLCMTHSFRVSSYTRIKKPKSNEFDILIFTQRWPPTVCFMWKEDSESHSCSLPKHNEWTIHGIWPTQYHNMGPEFCNRSLQFDKNILAPLESSLKESWIDIQNGSAPYSFWKHEWDKHGTCAVTIEALNGEFKYFQTALKFLDNYNMKNVLAKENIVPKQKYRIQEILFAIKKVLNKTAEVTCTKNEKTEELYISEIRICFDKTLKLIDCDGIYHFPTNCDESALITYPDHVPRNYNVQHNYNVIQI